MKIKQYLNEMFTDKVTGDETRFFYENNRMYFTNSDIDPNKKLPFFLIKDLGVFSGQWTLTDKERNFLLKEAKKVNAPVLDIEEFLKIKPKGMDVLRLMLIKEKQDRS